MVVAFEFVVMVELVVVVVLILVEVVEVVVVMVVDHPAPHAHTNPLFLDNFLTVELKVSITGWSCSEAFGSRCKD